jgi:hypothetical protein
VTGRTSSGGGSSDIKEDEFESLKLLDVDNPKRKSPNLQNINKKNKALRNILRARDECYWISADFKQAEVGCAASISKDNKLIEVYMGKNDLHTQIASEAFGIPYDKVDENTRRDAKFITFGILYGISPVGLAKRINKPIEEAEKLMSLYFSRFPDLKKLMDNYVHQVDLQGYVESPFHRKRRFPIVSSKSYRQAMNQPIQATSSDLLLYTMCKLYELIDAENLQDMIFPVLAVHDELDVEVKRGYIRTAKDLITRAMTEEIYKDPVISACMGPIRLGIDLEISPLEGGWGQHQSMDKFSQDDLALIDQGLAYIGKDMQLHRLTTLTYSKSSDIQLSAS